MDRQYMGRVAIKDGESKEDGKAYWQTVGAWFLNGDKTQGSLKIQRGLFNDPTWAYFTITNKELDPQKLSQAGTLRAKFGDEFQSVGQVYATEELERVCFKFNASLNTPEVWGYAFRDDKASKQVKQMLKDSEPVEISEHSDIVKQMEELGF